MDLQEIFNEYILKSEQIIITKRSISEITKNEINGLIQKKENEEKVTGQKNTTHSMDFFFIQDAKTGETTRYNHTSSTVNEKIEQILFQKNKQYQWILSESYEIFKEFVIKAYAYLGYTDKNIWVPKDYGNITMSELESKDYSFFLKQAKNKKDVPESILNKFRNTFQEYKRLETSNKLEKNLKLEINLIEHFRHIIVHCGGKTSNKEALIKKILEKSGFWNNGKNNEENRNFTSSFFQSKGLDDIIILLEIEGNNDGFPGEFHDILEDLINSLTSVTHIIFNEMNRLREK